MAAPIMLAAKVKISAIREMFLSGSVFFIIESYRVGAKKRKEHLGMGSTKRVKRLRGMWGWVH